MAVFKIKFEEEIIMAKVGDRLTAPETGWRRYDDTASLIQYGGLDWAYKSGYYQYYNNGYHTSTDLTNTITFSFEGTKLRIIGVLFSYESEDVTIQIDGIAEHYNSYKNVSTWSDAYAQVILFEKTDLDNQKHIVKLFNNSTNGRVLLLDAVDIDDTGFLLPIAPGNLTATAGDAQVKLSWDAVSGATSYTVKRSTTAGGPYTIISSGITGTSYVDTDVVNGTTYYYVVTAVDSDGHESDNSNEASATPQALGSHGLLRITMADSSEREYELTDDEISQFIAWCNRTVGTGNSLYSFDKTYNIGEFKNRKEYLMFEKIISFEVMELTK